MSQIIIVYAGKKKILRREKYADEVLLQLVSYARSKWEKDPDTEYRVEVVISRSNA